MTSNVLRTSYEWYLENFLDSKTKARRMAYFGPSMHCCFPRIRAAPRQGASTEDYELGYLIFRYFQIFPPYHTALHFVLRATGHTGDIIASRGIRLMYLKNALVLLTTLYQQKSRQQLFKIRRWWSKDVDPRTESSRKQSSWSRVGYGTCCIEVCTSVLYNTT